MHTKMASRREGGILLHRNRGNSFRAHLKRCKTVIAYNQVHDNNCDDAAAITHVSVHVILSFPSLSTSVSTLVSPKFRHH